MTSSKTKGEMLLFVTIIMEGLYPVLVQRGITAFSPIFFASISSLISCFLLFWYLLFSKQLTKGLSLKVFGYIAVVVICIIFFGHALVFFGSQYTTGINVGLLLRFELVTTFLVGTMLLKDRLETVEFCGALCIILGTFLIVFNGSFSFNKGDALVLISTFFLPFGNMYAKKALQYISPFALLFWRYLLGGSLLLVTIPFIEPEAFSMVWTIDAFLFLLLFGSAMLIGSKACFYFGLQQLQITNIIFYVSAGASIITLLASYILLGEVPSAYQWIGFAVSLLGAFWMTSKGVLRPNLVDPV